MLKICQIFYISCLLVFITCKWFPQYSNSDTTAYQSRTAIRLHTIPSTPPRSKRSEAENNTLPSTINVHIDDLAMRITKPSDNTAEVSTSSPSCYDADMFRELNASPTTVQYLKQIRKHLNRRNVIIQGALPMSSLFLGVHYDDQAYTCTGLEKDAVVSHRSSSPSKKKRKRRQEDVAEEKGTLQMSSWFKKLMIDLSQRKLALVRL